MSLSLTRRIARTALLIAAGAAPVVGAAGAASAAALPQAPNLGGVTALDGAGLGNTVDGTAHQATGLANGTGTTTLKKAVPTVGHAAKKAGTVSAPVGKKPGLPGGLPTDRLPLKGLPLGK